MRGMILAAGLGTRMHPFTQWCAKPALPVRGIPLIAYLLRWFEAHGIHEVVVNLHHQPDTIREAVAAFGPPGVEVRFISESVPRGTGGGIQGAAEFLAESPLSVVVAGDMILDLDLTRAIARHEEHQSLATLLLRSDPRAAVFGTIGLSADGSVRRIAKRFDLGDETQSGVFMGVRIFSAEVFDSLPARPVFEDLGDWLAPRIESDGQHIRGALYAESECVWEPVGTPVEYLQANLAPRELSYMDADFLAEEAGTRFEADLVVGSAASIGANVDLQRSVIWSGENVPAGTRGVDGVFAYGKFHKCLPRNRQSR